MVYYKYLYELAESCAVSQNILWIMNKIHIRMTVTLAEDKEKTHTNTTPRSPHTAEEVQVCLFTLSVAKIE